jgi:hypothetical protein
VTKDYVELAFSYVDNGDDKVCVEVHMGERKQANFVCDMYMPVISHDSDFEESKFGTPNCEGEATRIMIAAAGHTVIVKDIKAKIVQRQDNFRSGVIDTSRCI